MTLDLFTYPHSSGIKARTPETSLEASEAMEGKAPILRQRCLDAIRQLPSTADEVAKVLGETVLAVRPRFSELRAMGLIVDTGMRRKNSSRRSAAVWRVAK